MLYPCNRVHKSRSTYCKQVQNFDIIEGSRAKTKQKPKKKKKTFKTAFTCPNTTRNRLRENELSIDIGTWF